MDVSLTIEASSQFLKYPYRARSDEDWHTIFAPWIERAVERKAVFIAALLRVDAFHLIRMHHGPQSAEVTLNEIEIELNRICGGLGRAVHIGAANFALVMPIDETSSLSAVIEEIREGFGFGLRASGKSVYATFSLGYIVSSRKSLSDAEIWSSVDLALGQALGAGGGQMLEFSPEMESSARETAATLHLVQYALSNRLFEIVFQPKVLLADPERIYGAEVLLRTTYSELRGLGPATFIPIAERYGLIGKIDLLVVDLLCPYIRLLRSLGLHVRFSVNLSPISLASPGFTVTLLELLRSGQVSPHDVFFELTEGASMDDSEYSVENIELLRESGFDLSVDDFGTGFSSLAYLQHLDIQEIKVDRSFVGRLGSGHKPSEEIVLAILRVASALGLNTVAEGVETEAQRIWLVENGCTCGQGFLFGRGLRGGDFIVRLMSERSF